MENWSDEQKNIFKEFREGTTHAVIEAFAGTGKTTTIIEGINHAPERDILLCAFGKRDQLELSARLTNPRAKAQTLHSVGFSFVRLFWENVFVNDFKKHPVSRADDLSNKVCGPTAPDAIKRLVSKLHSKGREIVPHATQVGDLTDLAYQFECIPDDNWSRSGYGLNYVEQKALEAMVLAAAVKPMDTGIDYADMIFLPVRNGWLQKRYDLVVVDEAQDMTVAQLEIAEGICSGRIIVVGDSNQAIYGFRGADSDSLNRLGTKLNAKRLPLTITYRCGRAITEMAAKLVPGFRCGPDVSEGIIEDLLHEKLTETANGGDFIISRLNAPLVNIAMSLLRANKRARIAGRDIGSGLKTLVKRMSSYRGRQLSVPEFLERVKTWEDKESQKMIAAGRLAQAELVHDRAEMLAELSQELESVRDIEARIEALFTDDGLGAANTITCSTVHKAKGREANRVFVLTSTLYPRGRVNREEKNIEYVAITRAKQHLFLVA